MSSDDAPTSSSTTTTPPPLEDATTTNAEPVPAVASAAAAVAEATMEAAELAKKDAAAEADPTTADQGGVEAAAAPKPEPAQPQLQSSVDASSSSDGNPPRTEPHDPPSHSQPQAADEGLETLFASADSSSRLVLQPPTTITPSSTSAAVPFPPLQKQQQPQQQHPTLPLPQSQSKAVHPDRKRDLLLQAREDRAQWVSKVPSPARDPSPPPPSTRHGGGGGSDDNVVDALWRNDPRFQAVAALPAVQRVPSALPLLSHLYRIHSSDAIEDGVAAAVDNDGPTTPTKTTTRRADATGQRLQTLLRQVEQDDYNDGRTRDRHRSGPDGDQHDPTHLHHHSNPPPLPPPGIDPEYWKAYRALWRQLHDPSRASLVQGMRSFCRPHQQQQKSMSGASDALWNDWSDASQKIRSYATAAAASHGTIIDSGSGGACSSGSRVATASLPTPLPDHTIRALEAFLHGQCRERVAALGWTDEAQRRDSEWKLRWGELQFIGPKHLDVACLSQLPTRRVDHSETDDDPTPALYLEDALDEAVQALQVVDLYHSPYDKLQQILAVYRCVNATLAKALNPANPSPSTGTSAGGEGAPNVLPSADDVLPTVILTVLRAKPDRLPFNLQFVEQCCPPDALRGEAGYAFTNLYGAVQFLLDLDLERPGAGLSSSIDPDEFRRSWQACPDKAIAAMTPAPSQQLDSSPPSSSDKSASYRLQQAVWTWDLPPRVVRDARRHGEALDVDWALEWWQKQSQQQQQRGQAPPSRTPSGLEDVASVALEDQFPSGGLNRSHRFLTARPDDVRLSDLPDLLEEYRTLVHVTERLRGERAAKVRAERKAQRRAAEQALLERAKDITPLLDAAASVEDDAAAAGSANSMNAVGVVLNGTHRGDGGPTP